MCAIVILALLVPVALKLAGIISSWWWALAPLGLLAVLAVIAVAVVASTMLDEEEYL